VAVLPVILTLLVAVHFWRIRKDGGLSRPASAATAPPAAEVKPLAAAPTKTFGLMGFVRHPSAHAGNVPDNTVHAWPHLFMAELLVLVVTVAGVLVLAFFFDAPLEEPVNVLHPPNPAKAPWYFLGLQELVSYDAFWGGVGIPTLAVIGLLLVPYIDRNTRGVGKWFARERLLANTLFLVFAIVNIVLIIIGTFFRGPNWTFVSPW
jgi:quinol-cytochrome oxidoreductase complex cytochrome b subunit